MRRLKTALASVFRDTAAAERRLKAARDLELEKFARWSWNYQAAVDRLDAALARTDRRAPYRAEFDSVHWALAAAISLEPSSRISRVLEIGTHNARFARLLSELFPDAEITTVDLPPDDSEHQKLYPDRSAPVWTKLQDAKRTNLAGTRIQALEVNSFFLPQVLRPGFDLVWVDAGHTYPEVAWDCCNAYHLCRDGALLMTDDILPDAPTGKTGMVTRATWEMLSVLDRLGVTQSELFLKRLNPATISDPQRRKYVGLSRVSKRYPDGVERSQW